MSQKVRQPQIFGDVVVTGSLEARGPLDLSQVAGTTFWVDPSSGVGDDSRDGTSKAGPLATMQEAVDRCTADAGDWIIRLPGTETVAEPVQFNKRGVTVAAAPVGLPARVQGELFTTYNNQSDGLSAAVVTAPTRLVGLGFAASDVSEEALLIDGTGGFDGGFNSIEWCRFSLWNGSLACGVRTQGGALNHLWGCEFDGLSSLNGTGFGTAAIIMETDGAFVPFYPRVEWCRFSRIGSAKHAILHSGAPLELVYAHNYMGGEGTFLDNNSQAASGMITDNWLGGANQAAQFDNMTNNTALLVDNHYDE